MVVLLLQVWLPELRQTLKCRTDISELSRF